MSSSSGYLQTLVGAILVGRYRLERVIAATNLSVVYRGVDTSVNRAVAIKLLAEPALIDRFNQEARFSRETNHPNIVRVEFERIDAPFSLGDGIPLRFMVMPFINGRSLKDIQRGRDERREKLDTRDALLEAKGILNAMADALYHLHRERRIVHRDIKPGNILYIESARTPYLIDLGIARSLNQTTNQPALTQMGVIIGTHRYMPPEQFLSSDVSEAADQYSLALTIYELLTNGVSPYQAAMQRFGIDPKAQRADAKDTPVWLDIHTGIAPTPLKEYRGDIPPKIWDALRRGMDKEPDKRFPDIRQFAAAFASAVDGAVGAVAPPIKPPSPSSKSDQDGSTTPGVTPPSYDRKTPSAPPSSAGSATVPKPAGRRVRQRTNPLPAILLIIPVIGVIGLLLLSGGGGAPPPTETPTPTATPTPTPTDTPTFTPSPTDTPTPSNTPTPTPSDTPTFTPTPTDTPTDTPTPSQTPTPSDTPTSTPTPIPIISEAQLTASAQPYTPVTRTPAPPATATRTPGDGTYAMPTAIPTLSAAEITATSAEQVRRIAQEAEQTRTARAAVQTATAEARTPTPTPSDTPAPTITPSPSATRTPTRTPSPTITPSFTATPTDTPTATETPTPTATPSFTPSPSDTPKPTVTPTDTPPPTRTPSVTRTPSPSPSLTPSSTRTPSATRTPTTIPTRRITPVSQTQVTLRVTAAQGAILRVQPSTAAGIVTGVPTNAELRATSRAFVTIPGTFGTELWYRVEYIQGGIRNVGWVSRIVVTVVSGSANRLPAVNFTFTATPGG